MNILTTVIEEKIDFWIHSLHGRKYVFSLLIITDGFVVNLHFSLYVDMCRLAMLVLADSCLSFCYV